MRAKIARTLVISWALAVPAIGLAQGNLPILGQLPGSGFVRAGFDDLQAKDQRRLDFYAERIVKNLMAWSAADGASDESEKKRLEAEISQLASRFITAADQYGLTPTEADTHFRQRFSAGFSGRLPSFMVGASGIIGVRELLSIDMSGANQSSGNDDDYVRSLRSIGQSTFGN